jgi:hypothetical protein
MLIVLGGVCSRSRRVRGLPLWQHATQSPAGQVVSHDFFRQHGDAQIQCGKTPAQADTVEAESTMKRNVLLLSELESIAPKAICGRS